MFYDMQTVRPYDANLLEMNFTDCTISGKTFKKEWNTDCTYNYHSGKILTCVT